MTPYGPYSKSKNNKYSLYGISHHEGTLNGGHYIA